VGQKITLGSKVKDTVTGFQGTATASIESLARQPQILVETGFDGKRHQEWFDESRIESIDAPPPDAQPAQ
jgi:hypothetical protein